MQEPRSLGKKGNEAFPLKKAKALQALPYSLLCSTKLGIAIQDTIHAGGR